MEKRSCERPEVDVESSCGLDEVERACRTLMFLGGECWWLEYGRERVLGGGLKQKMEGDSRGLKRVS